MAGVTAKRYWVYFGGNENVLKLIVVMEHNYLTILKVTELYSLNE